MSVLLVCIRPCHLTKPLRSAHLVNYTHFNFSSHVRRGTELLIYNSC